MDVGIGEGMDKHHLPHSISVAILYRYRPIIIGRETTTAFFCQRHSGQSVDKKMFFVVVRSECAVLRRGMLCRQSCVLLPYVSTLSANNWKLRACSRALTESTLDDILDCLFQRYTNTRIDCLIHSFIHCLISQDLISLNETTGQEEPVWLTPYLRDSQPQREKETEWMW